MLISHYSKKKILALFIISFACANVNASAPFALLAVPFQNILLNSGAAIQATYSFGNHPIIFCYEGNLQTIAVFTWPYRGRRRSSTLSVPLITNDIYQGEFADPQGRIQIFNNTSGQLSVNCQFAF